MYNVGNFVYLCHCKPTESKGNKKPNTMKTPRFTATVRRLDGPTKAERMCRNIVIPVDLFIECIQEIWPLHRTGKDHEGAFVISVYTTNEQYLAGKAVSHFIINPINA